MLASMNGFKTCDGCNGSGRVLTGRQARKLRTKAAMTLKQVALKMGVSIVYVSDLERGQRNFRGTTTLGFLKAVGASELMR